mmetsp:Transcript_14812/g.22961  ORF Transcript_14812/g.22961 Transcript_14812/m.22961 type:complete len:144 (+) Transcript_14812:591-1022(+)
MTTRLGTPNYISPEVLAKNYGVECDMWSAGCILYILLCGYPPFYGENEKEIMKMISKGQFDFDGEEWDSISDEAKNLISRLITSPRNRLTASQALAHPWFKKVLKEDKTKTKALKLKSNKLEAFRDYQRSSKIKQIALTAISV